MGLSGLSGNSALSTINDYGGGGSALLLPDLDYVTPGNDPGLQIGWDLFTLPLGYVDPGGTPRISTMQQDANPGDCVVIAGDVFTSDINFLVYNQTLAGGVGFGYSNVLKRTGNVGIVKTPSFLPKNSMSAVYPTNSVGIGLPFALNRTEAWWIACSTTGYNFGLVGDTAYVHGLNLINRTSGLTWIWLQALGGTGQFLTATITEEKQIAFIVPSGLAGVGTSTDTRTYGTGSISFTTQAGLGYTAGMEMVITTKNYYPANAGTMTGTVTSYSGTTLVVNVTAATQTGDNSFWFFCPQYQVWPHNGEGGKYGWSLCLQRLTIATLISLGINYAGYTKVADVGTGVAATDTAAIQAAITDVQSQNPPIGTVQLQGTYAVNSGFNATFCNIQGTGIGVTIVKTAATFSDTILFDSGANTAQLKNLSIDTTLKQPSSSRTAVARLVNVNILDPYAGNNFASTVSFSSQRGYMTGCTITGQGIFGQDCSSIYVDNSTFYEWGFQDAAIDLVGVRNVRVTNSSAQDFDYSTGKYGVTGRLIHFGNACYNLYVDDNTTVTTNGLHGNNGQGEQILFDGNGVVSTSIATAGGTSGGFTTITLADVSGITVGYSAFCTNGTGVTQFGRITAINSLVLTLDRLFRVTPDNTTRVNIVSAQTEVIIVGCSFKGSASLFSSGYTACAVQTYNSVGNFFVSDCTATELADGFNQFASITTGVWEPNYNTLFKNLTITNCQHSHRIESLAQTLIGYPVWSAVGRNVIATNIRDYQFIITTKTEDFVVIDGSSYVDAPIGFSDGGDGAQLGSIVLSNSPIVLGNGLFPGSQGIKTILIGYDVIVTRGTSVVSAFESNNVAANAN